VVSIHVPHGKVLNAEGGEQLIVSELIPKLATEKWNDS
jgi:hypothetical protein